MCDLTVQIVAPVTIIYESIFIVEIGLSRIYFSETFSKNVFRNVSEIFFRNTIKKNVFWRNIF